ncbi:MAG: FecR domain-containing protein [Chitinispirillales bacterium]|jgi:hypothetical protein|nr:FecR domain-containing protein [Chitinispirillales bacterium]
MTTSHRKIGILATILVFSCAAPIFAQAVAEVKGIMGQVKVLTARDRGRADVNNVTTWPDARLNMQLRENDRIATLGESEVRLETADGSLVRLRERTTIEIAMLKGNADAISARMRLTEGNIVASVQRVAGGRSSFELETPTSLAAIRGTTVELGSRRGGGTTLKTFDGLVQVAPARNNRNFSNVNNYEMTEIAHGDRNARVRAVPSFYRPRTTTLLSEEESSALTGFTRVILTLDELEEIQRMLEDDGIASAIGIGESNNKQVAVTTSADDARTQLAVAMSTQIQRLSESYAQNIEGQAKTIWEESVRQMTNVSVNGSTVRRTIIQFNPTNGRYRVFSLMVINPNRTRTVLSGLTDRMEEMELRVRKDDMMARMDASINAFNTRYHDR